MLLLRLSFLATDSGELRKLRMVLALLLHSQAPAERAAFADLQSVVFRPSTEEM